MTSEARRPSSPATCRRRAPRPVAEATFHSDQYADPESIVHEFLVAHDLPVDCAAFGAAGPVVDGHMTTINLPWIWTSSAFQSELELSPVRPLNDLTALAHAAPHLQAEDLQTLHPAEPDSGGAIAVIAPSTGLGEAFLTRDDVRANIYTLDAYVVLVRSGDEGWESEVWAGTRPVD